MNADEVMEKIESDKQKEIEQSKRNIEIDKEHIIKDIEDCFKHYTNKTMIINIYPRWDRGCKKWYIDHTEVELIVNNFIKDKNNNSKKYDYVITSFTFEHPTSDGDSKNRYNIIIEIRDKNLTNVQEAYLETEAEYKDNENTPIANIVKDPSYFPIYVYKRGPKTEESRCIIC